MPPTPDDFASMHDVMEEGEYASREEAPYEDSTPPSEGRSDTLLCLHGLGPIRRGYESHRHFHMKRPPISHHTDIYHSW